MRWSVRKGTETERDIEFEVECEVQCEAELRLKSVRYSVRQCAP